MFASYALYGPWPVAIWELLSRGFCSRSASPDIELFSCPEPLQQDQLRALRPLVLPLPAWAVASFDLRMRLSSPRAGAARSTHPRVVMQRLLSASVINSARVAWAGKSQGGKQVKLRSTEGCW